MFKVFSENKEVSQHSTYEQAQAAASALCASGKKNVCIFVPEDFKVD